MKENETIIDINKGGKFVNFKFNSSIIHEQHIIEIEFSIYPFTIKEILINSHVQVSFYIFSLYIGFGFGLGK